MHHSVLRAFAGVCLLTSLCLSGPRPDFDEHQQNGVVLTGTRCDGAVGALRIMRSGGRVLTQDKASSAQFGMPEAAIRTESVDFVLPLSVIAHALTVLVMVAGGAGWFQVGNQLAS